MIKCPYINSTLVDNITKLVTVKDLNSAEVIAGVNGYLTRHPNVTLEQLLNDRAALNTVMQGVRDRQQSREQLIDQLWIATRQYTRDEVASDSHTLYIFTDNTDRDSGKNAIAEDSWYAKKYGQGHHYPTVTTAILRGLDNARPISTQRWYHEGAKGATGRWTDADFEEFKQVIDDEFEAIEEAWNSGKYKAIVLPKDGLFNSSISGLNSTRTPKLYAYLLDKYMKLVDMTVGKPEADHNKVGEADLVIIDSDSYHKSIDKMTVAKTPSTLYIFNESAQQRQALTGEKSPINGVEEIEEDKKNNALNKSTSTAIVRTDVNGKSNENAKGLITRKNRNGVNQARMTNEDLETWKQVIDADIQAIKEALSSGKYKKVIFPSSIVGELSRQMADYLQEKLQKELGILSQVISTQGDKFKVELNPVVAPRKSSDRTSGKKIETSEGKDAKTAKEKRIEAAKESLSEQRPTEVVAIESDLTNILLQAFPDIHERKAKVDFITTKFSDDLTWLIESELEYLNDIPEEDLDTKYKDTSLTYRQMKDGLTRGDYSKIRLFALENLRVDIWDFDDNHQGYRSIMDSFFHMKSQNEDDYMDGTMWAMVQAVANSEVDELAETLQDENSYLGKYFMLEAAQKGWTKASDTLAKRASARAAHLKSVFEILSDKNVWVAVLDEARFDLDVNEGVVITDLQVAPSKEELENSELDEENLNVGKMDFIMKYRLRDPWTTLSAKMKSTLSGITKMRRGYNGALEVMFNDLGMPIRMNSSYVYYVLLDELSDSLSIEDFDNKLDVMLVKYPWMNSIVSRVKAPESEDDVDLRRELYRSVTKAYVQYGYISGSNGRFTSCNVTSASEVLFDNIQKNYEGGIILSERYSVYDEYGRPSNNIAAILGSFNNTRKLRDRELLKAHSPLFFAETVLKDFSKASTPDLRRLADALAVLRGDKVPTRDKNGNVTGEATPNKITLGELLRAIGIDTDSLDLNSLVPSLESTDEYSFSLSPTTGDVMRVNNETEEAEPVLTRNQIGRLSTLLNVIKETISNFNATGNPLVHDNKARIQLIASTVGVVSEGFTQNMFRFGDKSRPSYTAPNFIDRMTAAIRLSSESEAIEYIHQNYTRFDFFKDNQLLNSMTNISSKGSSYVAEILRKNFSYVQLLAIGGRDKKNEIQRVSKDALLEGIINMYFTANSDAGINFGYYRNPLFSDVDAMAFFKLRRYTAGQEYDDEGNLTTGDYKDRIIGYLVQSVKQELKRISAVRKRANDRDVEFFNEEGLESRGAQFNFFPEFNEKEIFDELMDMYEFNEEIESKGQWEARVNEELTKKVRDLLESGFRKFSDSVSIPFKVSLYDRLHNESKDTDKSQIGNEDPDALDVSGFEEDDEDSEDSEETQAKSAEIAAKLAEAETYLEEFFYNDYFAQNQLIQVLGGDLAYYKNFTDFIKRNKQAFAGGERLYYQDRDGNELVERGLYVEDVFRASNTLTELSKMLDEIEGLGIVEKGLLKKSFADICLTDGQSLRVLDSFKTLFEAMGGKWTQDMNETYQRMQNRTFTREDFKTFLNAIKPFVFTYEESEHNGRLEKIVTQHKNSEYLLSAAFSFLKSPVQQSKSLQALQEFMEREDVGLDVVHFHSVVKEGFNNSVDISHDPEKFAAQAKDGYIRVGSQKIAAPSYSKFVKNLGTALVDEEITSEEYNRAIDNLEFSTKEDILEYLEKQLMVEVDGMTYIRPEMVHEVSLKDYMIMQPTDDHLTDTQALEGSQCRNIIPADLPETFTMTVNINGKTATLNREEAIAYYNELHDRQYIEAFEKLTRSFSDMKSVEGMLQSAMRQQPAKFSPDFRRAATLDGTGEEFWIPFNTPLMTGKIEDLFLSNFKNHIQKQRIKGGNAVLVSNIGLHDKLHVKYKKVKGADGKEHKAVEYIPCYLSYTMKDQLEDFLTEAKDGTFSLDHKKMRRVLGKDADSILEAIGYRIPTEDKYSMFPLRIEGFMPSIGGSVIMLPSDIITMSGTDFDIDKLFIMLKTLRRETYDRHQLAYEYNKWLAKNQLDGNSEMKAFFEAWDSFLEDEEREKGKSRPELFNSLMEESEEDKTKSFTDERTIKRLTKGKPGLTDQELQSLRSSSETFNAFMDELGNTFKFSEPSYRVLSPRPVLDSNDNLDLEATLKGSNKEERDNMIIDFMFKTLTSPEGSRLMMRMGHFTSPKNSSRQQRIMGSRKTLEEFLRRRCNGDINLLYKALSEPLDPNNTLWGELDDFYNKFSETVNPMDIMGYVNTRKNLMDGNDLIGILAVNSSAHYKLQFLNLKLREGNQVVINGMVLDKIDQVYSPINGKRIGELCAQLQAAAPDNGKDPCLGDMNLSPATADLAGFLVRLGIDIEDVGMILNATDVFNYGRQIAKNKENKVKLVDKHKTFDLNMDELTAVRAKLVLGQELTDEDKSFMKMFYIWRTKAENTASQLSILSPILRCDSSNGALDSDMATAIKQVLMLDYIRTAIQDRRYPIEGVQDLIDFTLDPNDERFLTDGVFDKEKFEEELKKAPIPRIQAVYSLGFIGARGLLENRLSQFSRASFNRMNTFMAFTDLDLRSNYSIPVIKQLLSEYNMFLLTRHSLFGSDGKHSLIERRNYYIHDFPIKLKVMLQLKDSEGNYRYPHIRNLEAIRRLSNRNNRGIKMDNMGKIRPEIRKWYTESFDQLINMGDKVSKEERELAKKLAVDLALYSFFDNGMTFRHNSFSNFFSSVFLSSIPGLIDAYREVDSRVAQSEPVMDSRFIMQFLMNHPENARKFKHKHITWETGMVNKAFHLKMDKEGTYPLNSRYIIRREDGSVEQGFLPVVALKIKGKYELFVSNGDQSNPIYTRIEGRQYAQGKPDGTLIYDATRDVVDIDYKSVKERGDSNFKVSELTKGSKRKSGVNEDLVVDNFSDDPFEITEKQKHSVSVTDPSPDVTFDDEDSEDPYLSLGIIQYASNASKMEGDTFSINNPWSKSNWTSTSTEDLSAEFDKLDSKDHGFCKKIN